MRCRRLGATDIELTEIGLGTWELSGDVWGEKDDRTSEAAILAGIEAGSRFIDTAADYGNGRVEELLGRLFSTGAIDRDAVVVCTKARPQNMQYAPPPEVGIAACFDPAWIRSECEGSLRRLRTDHLDLFLLHTWSAAWGHEDGWHNEMARLRDEGKIRAIGISVPDEGVAAANVAIARGQVDVVQCVYSVFQQEPEYTLFPLAAKYGVGIIARSPFSSGALVQQWHREMEFADGDWRASWPRDSHPDWLAEQVDMGELVQEIIATTDLSRPEFCLKYVLGNSSVTAVIPGSSNPDHVRSNLAVTADPGLDTTVLTRLRELWLTRQIHGTYNGSD